MQRSVPGKKSYQPNQKLVVDGTAVRAVPARRPTASAVLLLVAGAFVVYYWLTLGGLLSA